MEEFTQLLKEFVAQESVSTDPEYKGKVEKTVKWLRDLFEENGFAVEVFEGFGNPIVYANFQKDKGLETCLVYGHYDVQPAEKSDGWESDPFSLTEREGKFIGRGVVDNKGQVLIHIYSVFKLIESGELKYNVKFLIEGDEETGGLGVGDLLRKRKDLFDTDHVLISDGEMPYKPVLTASFRGTFNATVRVKTAENNLHSGLYGGAVPNAAEELSNIVASINDKDYVSRVTGFYSKDEEVTKEDAELCKEMDKHKKQALRKTGIRQFFLDKDDSFCGKVGFQSMVTVSGLQSGYTGAGYSNIVPNTAEARVNFRLAAWQSPEKALEQFQSFVGKNAADYVDWEVTDIEATVEPVKVDLNSPKHKEVMKLLSKIYGEKVLIDFCGATIPVVADFQQVLGIDPLLVSLANDDCNMHGVNENFDVGLVEKGLAFSHAFFGGKAK